MKWWDAVRTWFEGKRQEKFPVPSATAPNPKTSYSGAEDWISKRANLTTVMGSREIAETLSVKSRAQSFFSARVGEAHILERLRTVSDAYSKGEVGWAEARTELKRFVRGEGKDDGINGLHNLGSTARLDLILTQNARMAAAVGQYQAGMDPDIKERFPCWRYVRSTAASPRDAHARYAGKVYRKDDPIWHSIFPPSDFNCKCSVEDCDDEPETPPKDVESAESGFAFDPAHAFEEFDLSAIHDEALREKTVQGLSEMNELYMSKAPDNEPRRSLFSWFSGKEKLPEEPNFDARSLERAQEETRKITGVNVNLNGIHDPECINALNRCLYTIKKERGLDGLWMIETLDLGPGVPAQYLPKGVLQIDAKKINHLLAFYKGSKVVNGKYVDSEGVLFEGHEYESIFYHELAHLTSLRNVKFNKVPLNKKTQSEERRKLAIAKRAMRKAEKNGDIKNISKYAGRNVEEFICESAVVERFDKQALPDYIKEMLKEVL